LKAKRNEIERALDLADGQIRLFLLHGPDLAGSRALAARLTASICADAERIDLAAAMLKADPALLADESASLSLFGGRRCIIVEGGGDELVDAVDGLMTAPAAGNPAIVLTGALKRGSKLLALVDSSALAMSFASYAPEGREADRLVADLAKDAGLTVASDVARRLAEESAGDRGLIAGELDKLALYLDAAPDRSAKLDHDAIDALCANSALTDAAAVVDAVLDGDPRSLDRALGGATGGEGVPLLRALGRRLQLLTRLRAEVERGNSPASVMASAGKSLFYKEKPAIARQLQLWTSRRLALASSRALAAEEALKTTGGVGATSADELLFALAQAAARRR